MHPRSHDRGTEVCIRRRGLYPGGRGSASGRGSWADPPAGTRKAGGTHPNGMFSCLNMLCLCGSGSMSLFEGILCVRWHSVSGSLSMRCSSFSQYQ